jgi:hypothetical protein
MYLPGSEIVRPDRKRVGGVGTADIVVTGALDDETNVVISRCVPSEPVKTPFLNCQLGTVDLTEINSGLDMERAGRIHNEDRIPLTAAWRTFIRKAGVVGKLVPVEANGVVRMEVVLVPDATETLAFSCVVDWSRMANSPRRGRP